MRLIDADALEKDANEDLLSDTDTVEEVYWNDGAKSIIDLIKTAPTIDAVPVTRCRDCKHRKAKMGDCYGNGLVLCNDGVWRDMDFFCADGERSEE